MVEVLERWDTLDPMIQDNILAQVLFEGSVGQVILKL